MKLSLNTAVSLNFPPVPFEWFDIVSYLGIRSSVALTNMVQPHLPFLSLLEEVITRECPVQIPTYYLVMSYL